jgi:predicted cupin superfamily sugar epimerase
VAPGFDFADFEMAEQDDLKKKFPYHSSIIEELTRQ